MRKINIERARLAQAIMEAEHHNDWASPSALFKHIGKLFGVSYNTIRKEVDAHGIHYRTRVSPRLVTRLRIECPKCGYSFVVGSANKKEEQNAT